MYRTFGEFDSKAESKSKLLELKSAQEKEALLRGEPLVCVYIYADWCEPCKHLAPDYEMLAHEKSSVCKFVKENLDTKLTDNITAVPTFQIFYNGKLVHSEIGITIDMLKTLIEKIISDLSNKVPDIPRYGKSSIREKQKFVNGKKQDFP